MKKLLVTIGLAAITALAHAQGTIAFGNGTLTRMQICTPLGMRNATAADGLNFFVFFGPAGSDPTALTRVEQTGAVATIGQTDGIMINAPGIFQIPGTEGGQVVSLQIRAWDAATGGQRVSAQTDIRQVTLAPTAGPGTVIWQTATGTNPNRFHPMYIGPLTPPPECIPEPSTLALGALGGLPFLFFRRKSTRR